MKRKSQEEQDYIIIHRMADGTILTDEELDKYKVDPKKIPAVTKQLIYRMITEGPIQ